MEKNPESWFFSKVAWRSQSPNRWCSIILLMSKQYRHHLAVMKMCKIWYPTKVVSLFTYPIMVLCIKPPPSSTTNTYPKPSTYTIIILNLLITWLQSDTLQRIKTYINSDNKPYQGMHHYRDVHCRQDTRVLYVYLLSWGVMVGECDPAKNKETNGLSTFDRWYYTHNWMSMMVAAGLALVRTRVYVRTYIRTNFKVSQQSWCPDHWCPESLWRQTDVAMSLWRHDDVIIASCVRWAESNWHQLNIGISYRLGSLLMRNRHGNDYSTLTSWNGNAFLIRSPVNSLHKGTIMQSFDVSPNKFLNKHSNGRWSETRWCSYDITVMHWHIYPFQGPMI